MLVVLPAIGRSLDRRGRFGRSGQGRAGQVKSGQVRSIQEGDQQATNPRCHQTPRLDHAALACASRWGDGRTKTRRATRHRVRRKPHCASRTSPWESAPSSSPRHLVPSIHPRAPRTHLSYMTSRNALRHVLARTTPSPSAKEPPYQRVYIVFFFSALRGQTPSRVNHLPSCDGSFIYRASTTGNVNCHCDIKALLICNSPARVVRVLCRVANMGGRACFRSPPPCSTGLPVLVVRARYPYSSSSLGAALRRPSVIGPAHIVSVSSHATAMQRCNDASNMQTLASRTQLW